MALMCAACGTDNRDAAKFCKGCGGKLVALPPRSAKEREAVDEAWGETVQSSLEEDLRADDLDEPTVIVPPGASRPLRLDTAASALASQPRRIRDTRRHGTVWALLGVVLLAAAAGGWYAYRARVSKTAAAPEPMAATAPAVLPVTAAPAPALAPPPTPEAPAVATVPPSSPSPPSPPAASTVAQSPPLKTPAAPPRPRKTAPPPVPPPTAAVVPSTPAPEPPSPVVAAPPLAPPPAPQSACGGRNFVATAQCMAAQCARAEFAAHAQCEPVRRQQRIDEEKRNPLYAN